MKIYCKYDELINPSNLKIHPQNRNKHPKDQIERLVKLYEYHGIRHPIIVSKKTGFIVAGHGRKMAAVKLGLKEFPVVYQEFDDEEKEYAFLQADNAIALWAELDFSSINDDIANLGPDFDIDVLGIKNFTIDVNEKGLCDEDEVPEKVETIAKFGQIYQLGDHRLMCGDSRNPEMVAALMNGELASAWISDPPYGINHVEVSQEKGWLGGYKKIANDELQDEELKTFIYECIETSKPHLKKGFAFYMWHAMKMQAYFSQAAAAGILFHRQIIWNKERFVFGRGQYHWKHELCLMGWLEGNEPEFYGERNQTTVWSVTRENDKIHPTQKPVELYEIPIRNHLKPGEIYMEPFAGSGVGIIAAEKCGVKCYAMEFEPSYVDVIIARFEKYSGKQAILIKE